MTEEKPKIAYCPSCGGPATRAGNEITCPECDVIFSVNRKGEARVKVIGIEDRLKHLEDAVFKPQKKEPEPGLIDDAGEQDQDDW